MGSWGHEELGGDSSPVQELLHHVTQIWATNTAFAALRSDGRVVTWGRAASGGDSSAVQDQLLQGGQHVYANEGAFVALKKGGSVVAWGSPHHGGKIPYELSSWYLQANVRVILTAKHVFAALKHNGEVYSW